MAEEARSFDSRGRARRKGRQARSDRSPLATGSIKAFLLPRVPSAPEIAGEESVLEKKIDSKSTATADDGFFAPRSRRLRKSSDEDTTPEKESLSAGRSSKRLRKQKEPEVEECDAKEHEFDLRMEARIVTEHYAVLSAGKPLHPFFQRGKALENVRTQSEQSPLCPVDPAPPFHVDQSGLNTDVEIDWSAYDRSFLETPVEACAANNVRFISNEGAWAMTSISGPDLLSERAPLSENFETITDFLKEFCGDDLTLDDLTEKYEWYQARTTGISATSSNRLWTDIYQPQSSEQLCGNRNSVSLLNDWLSAWKEKIISGKLHVDRVPTEVSFESDGDYFDDGSDGTSNDDEPSDDTKLKNTLLLTGPVGSGKSAAVYACANEQGFSIIEISASDSRAGVNIKHKFGEASVSQSLNWGCLEVDEKLHGEKWTMILFEDVDLVFEEDKGFFAALVQFAKSAKRPIVLTSNRREPLLPYMKRAAVDFTKPAVEDMVVHACMVCLSHGLSGDPWLMKSIVEFCHQDLRKLMMLLQFWGQGALSSRATKPSEKRNDQDYTKWLSRVSWSDDLQVEHSSLPQLASLSFPCSLSQEIARRIMEAVEEVERTASLSAAHAAEEVATLQAELKRGTRKAKRQSSRPARSNEDMEQNSGFQATLKACGGKRWKRLSRPKGIVLEPQAEIDSELVTHTDMAESEQAADFGPGTASQDEVHSTTSTTQFDPVRAQWIDFRSGQCSLPSPNSEGLHLVLKADRAMATVEEAFSSLDIMSASLAAKSSFFELSQQLARGTIHHLSKVCDEASHLFGSSVAGVDPRSQQHRDKLDKQSNLRTDFFLANPRKTRMALTPTSFFDYISYMARIVAIEDHQKLEELRPRSKRSRGYQENYLSTKGLTTESIGTLRQLSSFGPS